MKNLIYLCFACCLFAVFNSCSKDDEAVPENQVTQTEETNHPSTKRTCGHDHHMQGLLSDPDYQKKHEEKFKKVENFASTRTEDCTSITTLPVAVHFQGISNPDAACLRELAKNQIDIINADFQGSNSDISNWDNEASDYFPGVENGDACLVFCLASQNHPNGYDLNNGDLAVTINQTSGDNVPAWSGYINIFVRPNLGYLGYSPLGGSGNGDGVVVDAGAFGSGNGCSGVSPQAPYNLGRTLTHELGHYLLLDHIWGGNGGCNDDDGVADTPVSSQDYGGCPNLGASSCNSTDMHMSYMDYTNDACMYMFSAGQIARAENYVATSLQNVANNAAAACGDVDPPSATCDDGIQNGDETGVDCGGSCEPCQAVPSCTDGIQNGDETGVDCGGSCEPCQTVPSCTDGVQNGDETGVDCGGSCAPCEEEATCEDGIQNGEETGVDCGGPDCVPCQVDDACATPSNINATVLGTTSAEISWSPVANAVKYRVRYRVLGTNQWSAVGTTNTFKVLSNLLPETTYQYRVRTICADERSPWSNISLFTTENDNDGDGACFDMNFSLIVDAYGNETSWEIENEHGYLVASGGPYGNLDEGDEVNDAWCLPEGCYTFTIYDEWGDGICCDYGYGAYEFTDEDGNVLFYSDGQFGYSESVEFCVEDLDSRSFNSTKDSRSANRAPKARNRLNKN